MKHKETILVQESSANYVCQVCNYLTCRKSQYNRHLATDKHKSRTFETPLEQNSSESSIAHQCICGINFNSRTTLWRHKKICNETTTPSNIITTELVMELIKDNKEMKQIIMEQNNTINNLVKNGLVTNNNTITQTNSHNKAFNLNLFLNETCKNAMNITDFVDSIKLQLSDLMEVGEVGYVEGISKIILKNLNNLDETLRPVHCTDKKRETMYVKDEGEWNKEDEKKTKLTKAVKRIADKNIRLLPQFREKYPEYKNSSSKTSDKYDKMVLEVMTTDENKNEKIITNISKVTTIKD